MPHGAVRPPQPLDDDILRHDGHALGVDGDQVGDLVGVLEDPDQIVMRYFSCSYPNHGQKL